MLINVMIMIAVLVLVAVTMISWLDTEIHYFLKKINIIIFIIIIILTSFMSH